MSDITNLTNSITHLRDRKKKSTFGQTNSLKQSPAFRQRGLKRERRFATDYFMMVAYSLLGASILSQIFLIVWLDII